MKRLFFICAVVFLTSAAQAQTPVALAPVPKPVFTQNGAPLVGGCLSTFSAGTTTPLASFTDSGGVSQNTNPIILDANGSPPSAIYLSAAAYKFQLKTAGGSNCSSGSTVWTADNVSATAFLNIPNTWTALQTFSAGISATVGTFNAGATNKDIIAGNINSIRFVDGNKFTTIQAAINDLP